MMQIKTVHTPAFVISEKHLETSRDLLINLQKYSTFNVLVSLKPSSLVNYIEYMSVSVNGFSCASLFEAILAHEISSSDNTLHITNPGLRKDEIDQISDICDYITFNSLSQWHQFKDQVISKVQCGLRVNPQLSLINDSRYDPCGANSKLGVPLDALVEALEKDRSSLNGITGIHFHTNCDSTDFSQLLRTCQKIDSQLSDFLRNMEWINLGGGYLFNEGNDFSDFIKAVDVFKSKYGLEVFIEPGASIVREAGYIVSTVLDIFKSDGKDIAILDTTVNHMPEVFEYQYEPDVLDSVDEGPHQYILAGCTCLAGDLFGEYAFNNPLKIGSRVVFANMGAYTLVKAHMFNGVNLPTIYKYTREGKLELIKKFGFEDFLSRCGVDNYVSA